MLWPRLRLYSWGEASLFSKYYPLETWLRRLGRLPQNLNSTPPRRAQPSAIQHQFPETLARTYTERNWLLEIYRLPKLGHQLHECEDAWAYACNQVADQCWDYGTSYRRVWTWEPEGRLTIAVSDGASDSFASADWAQMLTYQAVQDAQDSSDKNLAAKDLLTVLTAANEPDLVRSKLLEWLNQQAQRCRSQLHLENLPWFVEAKAQQGSHATLLVADFELSRKDGRTCCSYRVLAIGDSCFFHFRGGKQLQIIPPMMSANFSVLPTLVSTNSDYNNRCLSKQVVQLRDGEFWPGDEIWLATDALAAWLVQKLENLRNDDRPVSSILPRSAEEIVTFLNDLRTQSRMKNDDVTFVRLRWQQASPGSRS